MNKKTYFAQIAGRINGVFYEVGAPVEIEGDAKPLIDLGIIAGDGNEIEAVTSEEFAETVNVLSAEIASLTEKLETVSAEKEKAVNFFKFAKKENEKQKELISELSSKMTALEIALSEKEKKAQPEPAAATSEVKEPAQTEVPAPAQKTSKKKS